MIHGPPAEVGSDPYGLAVKKFHRHASDCFLYGIGQQAKV
jgi:hypothetical protein